MAYEVLPYAIVPLKMMKISAKIGLGLVAGFLCSWGASTASAIEPGRHERSLIFDGRPRSYVLFVPSSYNGVDRVPLVLVLHGGGHNAALMEEMTGFSVLAEKKGFIVVYPNGTGRREKLLTWNAGNCCGYARDHAVNDVDFIAALMDALRAELTVDGRVYVTGISNGGMLAYAVACAHAEKIAAIAPVAGALNAPHCIPRVPVSVIAFHGTADRHVLYEGGQPFIEFDAQNRKDRSVAYAMKLWRERNNCELIPQKTENARYKIETWSGGSAGTEVVLVTLKKGPHAWPGGRSVRFRMDDPTTDVDATAMMWDFFEKHPQGAHEDLRDML